MTTITVKGQTEYGYAEVKITGDKYVKNIDCPDDFIKEIISESIKEGEGYMANAFHPEPNTMLQAFAFLVMFFPSSNVIVEGELETIPYEPGVIY